MKVKITLRRNKEPILNIIPKDMSQGEQLRDQIRGIKVENPCVTFAREHRRYKKGLPSEFSNLSDDEIAVIAFLSNNLAEMFKTEKDRSGEYEIPIMKLLDNLINFAAPIIKVDDEDEES